MDKNDGDLNEAEQRPKVANRGTVVVAQLGERSPQIP